MHVAPTFIEAGNSIEYAIIPKRLRSAVSDGNDSAFDESGAVAKTMYFQTQNQDAGYDPKNQIQCRFAYPKIPINETHYVSTSAQPVLVSSNLTWISTTQTKLDSIYYEPFVISARGMPGLKASDKSNIMYWFDVEMEFRGRNNVFQNN